MNGLEDSGVEKGALAVASMDWMIIISGRQFSCFASLIALVAAGKKGRFDCDDMAIMIGGDEDFGE